MNAFRGYQSTSTAVLVLLLLPFLLPGDFWITPASARYYCGSAWIPRPDPDEVVWLPWKTFCDVAQEMPSSPGYWLIDDYPDVDIADCAQIGEELDREKYKRGRPECAVNVIGSEYRKIYDLPIACNGNANPDYFIGGWIENYEATYEISCEGESPYTLTNSPGSKYFVREPVGPDEIIEEKNYGLPQCGLSAGNPINIATGNKYHRQVDVELPEGLEVSRHYNSKDQRRHSFGAAWRSNYSRSIVYTAAAASAAAFIELTRDDGSVNYWRVEDSVPLPPPDARGRLEVAFSDGQAIGFTYRHDGTIETYGEDGKLLSVENSEGVHLRFGYVNSQLVNVTTPSGRRLVYSRDTDGKILRVSSNSGAVWHYSYDQYENLVQLENPDGSIKAYHYEDARFPHSLTGESDGNGNRLRSWAYDEAGRAILSVFGDAQSSIERYAIDYNPDGTSSTSGPLQNSLEYGFKSIHGITRLAGVSGVCSSCDDKHQSATYDDRGNLDLVYDFRGFATDYDYTADNLVQKVTHAPGTPQQYEVDYAWDSILRKPTQIIRGDLILGFTYNSRGQVLTRTETDRQTLAARSWRYRYHETPAIAALVGKLEQVDGPRNDVADITDYEYYVTDHAGGDYLAGDAKAVINALGHRIDYLKYDGDGRLMEMSDANGVVTSIRYNSRGWKLSATTDGKATVYAYDDAGKLVRVTQPDGSFMAYEYDDVHRLKAIADTYNNRVEYTLDPAGNRVAETTYDETGALRRQLSRIYDQFNRLDTLMDGNHDQTRFTYDDNGNRIAVHDANLNAALFEYDGLNRNTKIIDAMGGETFMSYDENDNLISVTDPLGNTTQYGYDGLGNLVQSVSPDTGVSVNSYDEAGNRTSVSDAGGVSTEYGYDALNRITTISYPDQALDVSFSYDEGAHGLGRLSGMHDATGSTEFNYDSRGNLLTEVRSVGAHQYITAFRYNSADRLMQITYPSGMVIDYTLDAAGRISRVEKGQGASVQALASDIQYEPFGPLRSFVYGNGLTYSATWDQSFELDRIQSGAGLDWILNYDPAGNIVNIADQENSSNNQGFSYDEMNRLETATGRYGAEVFSYDGNGNRLRYSREITEDGYSYESGSNRLATQGAWVISRDGAGNRTGKLDAGGFGQLFDYAGQNRLARVVARDSSGDTLVGVYGYDGHGRRTQKTTAEKALDYLYGPSGELLGEYSVTPAGDYREFVYLAGKPVAAVTSQTRSTTPAGRELIIDNGDPGTTSQGSWRVKYSSQEYGADYLFANKADGQSYRWTATPPGSRYQLYAWWVGKGNQTAEARFTVRYGSGETAEVTKSQKAGGGQWQLLGSYHSTDGQDYVEVRSEGNKLVADAIRMVEVADPVETVIESTNYIHFDHLGSPRQVTDGNQAVIWRWDSRPFGNSAPDEDPDGDLNVFSLDLRFPGQYYDAETGLHYNYFRTYDPVTGRYLESDPIGLEGGLNTFSYANNNSLLNADRKGLAYFAFRPLQGLEGPSNCAAGTISDRFNIQPSHEQLFFEDGKQPANLGFFSDSLVRPDKPENLNGYSCQGERFDDCVMRKAVAITEGGSYCLLGIAGAKNNCQDWAERVRANYRTLILDPSVRAGCSGCTNR
jgi:RHS repeat-associated protein